MEEVKRVIIRLVNVQVVVAAETSSVGTVDRRATRLPTVLNPRCVGDVAKKAISRTTARSQRSVTIAGKRGTVLQTALNLSCAGGVRRRVTRWPSVPSPKFVTGVVPRVTW